MSRMATSGLWGRRDFERFLLENTALEYPKISVRIFSQPTVLTHNETTFTSNMIKSSFIAILGLMATLAVAQNKCLPDTDIKEYHPFYLKSANLDSYVSKNIEANLIVGGINGNKNFQQLKLCIVSSDHGCDKDIAASCIYEHVDYRIRVHRPMKGYLKVRGVNIEIVEDFHEGSGLHMFKEEGWGLRIGHVCPDGTESVFATNGGGNPLTMEKKVMNENRQWFQLVDEKEDSGIYYRPPMSCQ
ncbi:hypothetical protein BGX27_009485 [Mortierella sp. AM989]|nr:hypothetical protein BGX27_009485 [Mortierella sp. AM989]